MPPHVLISRIPCIDGLCAAARRLCRAGTPARTARHLPRRRHAPGQQQPQDQTVAPPAAPAGQAAPGSESQDRGATRRLRTVCRPGKRRPRRRSSAACRTPRPRSRAKTSSWSRSTPPARAARCASRGRPKRARARSRRRTAPAAAADKESRCATACKAFASLKRAADAVCRLAGDDDARCDHAKKLVERERAARRAVRLQG